jgi:aurora kinase
MLQKLNNVKNRFMPIPESVEKNLENEPKITDFEILKELGSSSCGSTYLIRHKVTKAEYALKAIDKRYKSNIEEDPFFRKGGEIIFKIQHPNMVKLYGHFEDNNYCYFIMEYIPKGNLYNLIPTDKKKE